VTPRQGTRPSTFAPVSSLAAARPARARLGHWPYDDDVAHLVLLDHHMVPTDADIAGWVDDATRRGSRTVRTGALFPNAIAPFLDAGFHVADTLALLTLDLHDNDPRHVPRRARRGGQLRLRRLRPSMLHEAAAIDRRAFSSPWANDAATLGDIMSATPTHRSRSVHLDGRMVAFSISGRANESGYVQRLAVDPSTRRHGFARLLLDDALRWMRRRDVEQVLLNTAIDNRPALSLYESRGFERRPESLQILERTLR
jgi:[ribosomal protein S18]-alanine N-acetyltransferase